MTVLRLLAISGIRSVLVVRPTGEATTQERWEGPGAMTVSRRGMHFRNMGRSMDSHPPGMQEPNLAGLSGQLLRSSAFRP